MYLPQQAIEAVNKSYHNPCDMYTSDCEASFKSEQVDYYKKQQQAFGRRRKREVTNV